MYNEKLPPYEPSFVISVSLTVEHMELIENWKQKLSEQRNTEVTTDEALHYLLWLAGNVSAGQEKE